MKKILPFALTAFIIAGAIGLKFIGFSTWEYLALIFSSAALYGLWLLVQTEQPKEPEVPLAIAGNGEWTKRITERKTVIQPSRLMLTTNEIEYIDADYTIG